MSGGADDGGPIPVTFAGQMCRVQVDAFDGARVRFRLENTAGRGLGDLFFGADNAGRAGERLAAAASDSRAADRGHQ